MLSQGNLKALLRKFGSFISDFDADGGEVAAVLAGEARQALLHFGEEAQRVPVEAVEDGDGAIGKAVQLFERQVLAVEVADDGAAAFGPEVKGEEFAHR